jgi:hypothetical protein
MTIVSLKIGSHRWIVRRMDLDALTIAKLLTTAALVAATIEYVEVIKRRVLRRAAERDRAVLEERSLQGLVRVFLADAPRTEALRTANR